LKLQAQAQFHCFKQITLSAFISELSFWSCVLLKRDGRVMAVIEILLLHITNSTNLTNLASPTLILPGATNYEYAFSINGAR
jgi:hypothetical protein